MIQPLILYIKWYLYREVWSLLCKTYRWYNAEKYFDCYTKENY